MRYLYKKVIAAVLVLIASAAYSQNNCKCDLYDSLSKSRKTKSALIADLSKEKSTICQALAMELKGESLIFDKDDLDAAEICLRKAEEIYRKTNCDEGVLWNTYKQRFQVYWNRSDFPNAQEYGLKFLQSAEKINSVYDQAIANTMIAIVFYKTNQFEKGLVFNDKAAELLSKITESKKRQKILYFLSVRYMAHYLATKSTASIQKSLTYNLQHLALSKELKDTVQFARSYFNLSGTEEENKNWNKAMVYLDSG